MREVSRMKCWKLHPDVTVKSSVNSFILLLTRKRVWLPQVGLLGLSSIFRWVGSGASSSHFSSSSWFLNAHAPMDWMECIQLALEQCRIGGVDPPMQLKFCIWPWTPPKLKLIADCWWEPLLVIEVVGWHVFVCYMFYRLDCCDKVSYKKENVQKNCRRKHIHHIYWKNSCISELALFKGQLYLSN